MTRALDDIDSSEGSEGEAEEPIKSVRQPASISPVAAPAASAVPLGSLESKAARAELHVRVASAGYAVLRRPRAAVAARDARAAVDALCSAFPPEAIARAHGAGDGPGQKHGYMSFLEEGFELFEARDHYDGRFLWPGGPLRQVVQRAASELRTVALEAAHALLTHCMGSRAGATAALAGLLDHSSEDGDLAKCSSSGLRILRYAGDARGAPRSGAPHTDNTIITAAPRADVPALEVCLPSSPEWLDVEVTLLDDDVLVFPGDALCAITRGALPALLHRVPPARYEGRAPCRLSTPYFLRARPGALLRPVLSPEHPGDDAGREQPLTAAHIECNMGDCRRRRPWMATRADAAFYRRAMELVASDVPQH